MGCPFGGIPPATRTPTPQPMTVMPHHPPTAAGMQPPRPIGLPPAAPAGAPGWTSTSPAPAPQPHFLQPATAPAVAWTLPPQQQPQQQAPPQPQPRRSRTKRGAASPAQARRQDHEKPLSSKTVYWHLVPRYFKRDLIKTLGLTEFNVMSINDNLSDSMLDQIIWVAINKQPGDRYDPVLLDKDVAEEAGCLKICLGSCRMRRSHRVILGVSPNVCRIEGAYLRSAV